MKNFSASAQSDYVYSWKPKNKKFYLKIQLELCAKLIHPS